MDFVPMSFTILQYCGVWPPTYYSRWKSILYGVYTSVIAITILSFCLSGIIQLCLLTRNLDELIKNSYMLLTTIGVSLKVVTVVLKRNHILETFESLRSDLCMAKNEEEERIQNESHPQSSYWLRGYGVLLVAAITMVTVTSVMNNIPMKTLPFSGWFPYNHTGSVGYWIAFIHQSVAHGWGGLIAVSFDTVIHSTMMFTCTQLKLLKSRWRQIHDVVQNHTEQLRNNIDNKRKWEQNVVAHHIQHQMHILQFVNICNYTFAFVIFVQFLIGGLGICMSVLMLTKIKFMSPEFLFIISYLGGITAQIFIYCWFGNEVILESSDIHIAIYESNWLELSLSTQTSLLTIMERSKYPIEFTSAHLITLSIGSFNALMKLSYSVYNVLSQSG